MRTDLHGPSNGGSFAMDSPMRVPVSSFTRSWTLGSTQARIAAGYFAYWIRSQFAGEDEKTRLRSEVQLSSALELLGTMGYLRGAVMKVGQFIANLPDVVPDEVADVLASLHFQAPPMHFSMVRELFIDEFGGEPEAIFASFDRKPFAAASLGQVHRARLSTGEDVAVKIQYPDIARIVHSDMRSLRVLVQPMRLSSDWACIMEVLSDVGRMLAMETDYLQEATFGKEMSELFSPGDGVVVPMVFEKYSTRRVLTTSFLEGLHLRDYLATEPSQEARDRFTERLVVATMRPLYRARRIVADPHPGNFLFMPDGRLGLLDFGCTRILTHPEWRHLRELEKAVMDGDEDGVDRVIARGCMFEDPSRMEPERLAVMRRNVAWQIAPFRHEGMFDFGQESYFRRGVEEYLTLARKRYTRSTSLHLWTTRFILGSRAVAYRLGGRCDFRTLYRRETAGLPP